MPYPSRRCRTCRLRRIKCSETYPVCQQCERGGRACEWDALPAGRLAFRSENAFASGEQARGTKHAAKAKTRNTAHHPSPTHSSRTITPEVTTVAKSHAQPSHPPSIPLDERALSFYISHYNGSHFTLGEGRTSFESHLVRFLVEPETGFLVQYSAEAISLAAFGNYFHSTEALKQAHQKCGAALKAVRKAISNPTQSQSDQFLVAVWLLSGYENLITSDSTKGISKFPYTQSFRHLHGARAVLFHRHRVGQSTGSVNSLDRFVRQRMIRSAIQEGLPIPDWMQDGSAFGEHGLDLQLDKCYVEVANFRSSARKRLFYAREELPNDSSTIREDLMALIHEAQSVEDCFAEWKSSLTPEWVFHELHGFSNAATMSKEPERAKTYDGTVHIYSDLCHATSWNFERAGRLICHAIVFKAALLCRKNDLEIGPEEAEIITEITSAATQVLNDVCASIPYFLEPDLLELREEGTDGNRAGIDGPLLAANKPQVTASTAFLLNMPLFASLAASRDAVRLAWLRSRLKIVSQITASGVLRVLSEVDVNLF